MLPMPECEGCSAPETRLQQLLRKNRNIHRALDQWQVEEFGEKRRSGFFDDKRGEGK